MRQLSIIPEKLWGLGDVPDDLGCGEAVSLLSLGRQICLVCPMCLNIENTSFILPDMVVKIREDRNEFLHTDVTTADFIQLCCEGQL